MSPLPAGPALPAPAQTLLYHRDPLGVLLRARARYGLLGRVLEAVAHPREAVDRLIVVIAAAQEPPAIALTNVVYELARRPELQDRFREDPATRDALVAEALRLRPAAQAALRELTGPRQVGAHALPAGTPVALPSLLLHRDRTRSPSRTPSAPSASPAGRARASPTCRSAAAPAGASASRSGGRSCGLCSRPS
jgi:hypothetical protein